MNDYEYDGCGDVDCISCYPDSVLDEDECVDDWCDCEECFPVFDGEDDCN